MGAKCLQCSRKIRGEHLLYSPARYQQRLLIYRNYQLIFYDHIGCFYGAYWRRAAEISSCCIATKAPALSNNLLFGIVQQQVYRLGNIKPEYTF